MNSDSVRAFSLEVYGAVMSPPIEADARQFGLHFAAIFAVALLFRVLSFGRSTLRHSISRCIRGAPRLISASAVRPACFGVKIDSTGHPFAQNIIMCNLLWTCLDFQVGGPAVCSNQIPNVLTMALHLYHMWQWTMKPIDLIHHIPAIIAATSNAWFPTGPIQNWTFLFIMGIPGGYDYALLVGVKYGAVGKMVEKEANSFLNLWIRSPGLIISSFCIFQSLWLHTADFIGILHIIVVAMVGLHNLWNAQYFMSRALESEVQHRLARQATKTD